MSTKATVRQLARQLYGSGATTDARRTICTWWRVEVIDSSGRVQIKHEDPSLRKAYARCAIRLRADLSKREDELEITVAPRTAEPGVYTVIVAGRSAEVAVGDGQSESGVAAALADKLNEAVEEGERNADEFMERTRSMEQP